MVNEMNLTSELLLLELDILLYFDYHLMCDFGTSHIQLFKKKIICYCPVSQNNRLIF